MTSLPKRAGDSIVEGRAHLVEERYDSWVAQIAGAVLGGLIIEIQRYRMG